MPTLDALKQGEIHLWFCKSQEVQAENLLRKYHQIMDPEEAERQARFVFAKHRHQFLVTRALVRCTLSNYLPDRPPDSWSFIKNTYGRPALFPEPDLEPLVFNLSHTDGLEVVAIAHDRVIGVDVEFLERSGELVDVADRFFSKREVADLHSVHAGRERETFFDYWTLKESYIKARGMGLSLPLGQFSFLLGDPLKIEFGPEIEDRPERWQFALWDVGGQHRCALAHGSSGALKVKAFQVVPSQSPEPIGTMITRTWS